MLNPEKDKFDWAPLDKITELSKKYKKKVAIRVSAAASIDATPEWLWNEIEWWPCIGKKKTELNKLRVPKVWDKNFVAAREKLIKAIAQRYDNNETVQRVMDTGTKTIMSLMKQLKILLQINELKGI